jgi:hypothetical protein
MKMTVLGALVGGVLVAVVAGVAPDGDAVFAQRPAVDRFSTTRSDLIALSETIDHKYQQVTLIDPKSQVMSVYHIELSSGTIALRSVRNFHWDLRMMDFNGASPLSREVQSLSEQR